MGLFDHWFDNDGGIEKWPSETAPQQPRPVLRPELDADGVVRVKATTTAEQKKDNP